MVWMRYVVPLDPIASMSPDEVATWLGRTFQLCLEEPLEPRVRPAGSGAG
jgi:hypothetical protein